MKRPSRRRTAGKAGTAQDVATLEDIPNVGPAVAADLLGCDPYALYEDLCERTGQRHDPCLLDTFIAAVRFMAGGPKKPWCAYSAERKRHLAARTPPGDSD